MTEQSDIKLVRSTIRFLRGGEVVELPDVQPNETILDYLRLRDGSTGTKEGCCEGDCGACTVAVGSLKDGKVSYVPINACIALLGSLDGKELVTVEDLSSKDGVLHPVQKSLSDHHGSQCGFCTPGFVMSLFVLSSEGGKVDRARVLDSVAGNLCRCTGYRPIVDAALEACNQPVESPSLMSFSLLDNDDDIFIGSPEQFFAAPFEAATLAEIYREHPDAVLVSGATDVGLWITKQQRDLAKIIYLGRIAELQQIEDDGNQLIIGAAATFAKAEAALSAIAPDIGPIIKRIGSRQVRAAGTIGGNIANGSPIGDSPPVLIALEARIELKSAKSTREIDLEKFFIEYGRQDIKSGEYISRIIIPHLQPDQKLHCYKISKRFDQDISSLLAAMRFDVKDGIVFNARLAFGGMAATLKRADKTEAAVNGLAIDDEPAWQLAAQKLAEDFTPLSDVRASAEYRLQTAKALLMKARAELSGQTATRIQGHGSNEHVA